MAERNSRKLEITRDFDSMERVFYWVKCWISLRTSLSWSKWLFAPWKTPENLQNPGKIAAKLARF